MTKDVPQSIKVPYRDEGDLPKVGDYIAHYNRQYKVTETHSSNDPDKLTGLRIRKLWALAVLADKD